MLTATGIPTINAQLRSENVHQCPDGPGFDSQHLHSSVQPVGAMMLRDSPESWCDSDTEAEHGRGWLAGSGCATFGTSQARGTSSTPPRRFARRSSQRRGLTWSRRPGGLWRPLVPKKSLGRSEHPEAVAIPRTGQRRESGAGRSRGGHARPDRAQPRAASGLRVSAVAVASQPDLHGSRDTARHVDRAREQPGRTRPDR